MAIPTPCLTPIANSTSIFHWQGDEGEAVTAFIDVFEQVGLAASLEFGRNAFTRVILTERRDMTNLFDAFSVEKGVARFYETWVVVTIGAILASLGQLGLLEGSPL